MTVDTNVKVSKHYAIMEAYKDIKDADQKIGNLAVYATDDIDNPMFSTPRRQTELGKAAHLGHQMINAAAREDEMIRFLRYYLTVLAKPELHYDYKQAAKENNIQELRKKYITSYKLD